MTNKTKALHITTASGSQYIFDFENKLWDRQGPDKHFLRGGSGPFDEFSIKPTIGLQLHFAGKYDAYPDEPRTHMKSTQPITRIEEIQ